MATTVGARTRPPADDPRSRSGRRTLFAGFWRWHFYASFLVIPILAVLAATGLIYLFRFQLEPLLHPDLMRVQPPAATATGVVPRAADGDQQLRVVEQALDDEGRTDAYVASMTEPYDASSPTRFTVALPDGGSRDYFVDPYRLQVLGSLDPDQTLSGAAVLIHGELMAGAAGDHLIELGACWAIVMALTGYYLFVRGRRARARAVRQARADAALLRAMSGPPARTSGSVRAALGTARTRQWHAVVGAVAGIALLGLLVSGLPWTGLWGAKAQEIATAQGTSFWSDDHGAISDPTSSLDESLPHSHARDVPWGMGRSERPTSDVGGYTGAIANLDTATRAAAEQGLRRPYTVILPDTPEGTFSVIGYAFDDPAAEQTVHVDRFTGRVVADYGYADYSGLAKVVTHGIALHEGRHFGTITMVTSAAMCLGILFLCVSGPILWWRRRPRGSGRIGAPRGKLPLRTTPVLLGGLILLGLFLPLFGASLLVIALLDQLVIRRSPRLQRWLDVRT